MSIFKAIFAQHDRDTAAAQAALRDEQASRDSFMQEFHGAVSRIYKPAYEKLGEAAMDAGHSSVIEDKTSDRDNPELTLMFQLVKGAPNLVALQHRFVLRADAPSGQVLLTRRTGTQAPKKHNTYPLYQLDAAALEKELGDWLTVILKP